MPRGISAWPTGKTVSLLPHITQVGMFVGQVRAVGHGDDLAAPIHHRAQHVQEGLHAPAESCLPASTDMAPGRSAVPGRCAA